GVEGRRAVDGRPAAGRVAGGRGRAHGERAALRTGGAAAMSWVRGILFGLIAAALAAFALGFWGFAPSVHGATPPPPFPAADGSVALTGGRLERLTTGMDLLASGHGRRLLISGVNPQVKDEELFKLLHASDQLFKCCVDIGRRAEDTLGNAAETAAWANRNG